MGNFLRLILFSKRFDWLGRAASFLASPLPPFGRAWRQEISIRMFRIFLLLSALLYPSFGFVYRVEYPAMIDPMAIRWGLSAAAILLLAASYRSEWIQRKAVPLMVGAAYIDILWFAGLAYLNALSYPYAIGLFFVYVAAAILSSGSFETNRPLIGMLVAGFGIVTATALAVPDPEASAMLLILSTGSIGLAIYVLVACYIQSMAILDRQHVALVEAQETAQMGSWEFDPLTGNQYWSEGMFMLLELDPARHQPSIEAFVKKLLPEDRPAVIRMLREGAPLGSARVRIKTKDGPPRSMLLTCEVDFGSQGQPVRYHGSIEDITANIEREQALIAARDEAEALAELKSTLLANMSHEIRTPLTAIIGFSEMLVSEVEGKPKEYADLISQGGRRLMHTLNSVLDLARLRSGNLELNLEPVYPFLAVEAVTAMFRRQAEEKGLELRIAVPESLPPLHVDPSAFDRILTNLISNAVKFTEVGSVTISAHHQDDQIVLAVADTGIGMAEEFLPRLFAEFRQESEGLTRSHEGSGLGMAITRELVEIMQGEIGVSSQQGRGTVFTLSFAVAGGDGLARDEAAVITAVPLAH